MSHNFRSKLKQGELLISPMVTLSCPETAEILSEAGYDWLFFDAEHSTYAASDLQTIIGRVAHTLPCLVRLAAPDEVLIKKALDLGAAGIIAPQVNTPELAEKIVSYAKYSPQGTRGVGLGRAHGYGFAFDDYLSSANDNTTVVVQAEHIDAVNNIEQIVNVSGVDAVLIGPYDLSASLKKIGEIDHPDVVNAIQHVTEVCQKQNMPLGIFGVTVDAIKPYIEKGFTLITVGVDTVMLGQAARKMLGQLK
ncbi:HpcH/HpaI aldolase family protein [Gimesia aquarii]|uniref:5-keto-4-deoxy-D-glucarate aldolase n=1 Tax=Gimesia aquarii TaxID=2527964 RepID=A0A517WUI0_9PLAN|nr:aldolase/citrate lyase family protein [Gimesia aquarii]QDU08921.1 5-keto-4-deoxy-D-glucarate aldolase [Gimesia aquarii]